MGALPPMWIRPSVPGSRDAVQELEDLDKGFLELRIGGAVPRLRFEQDPVLDPGLGHLFEKPFEGRGWNLLILPAVPEEERGGVVAQVGPGREEPERLAPVEGAAGRKEIPRHQFPLFIVGAGEDLFHDLQAVHRT